ncbi:MAG: hypothetical protein IJY31_01055 [Muribaculaceae bacterium]|nr:hypothetical protein [Muribaculaceae bacterium]
MKRFAVILVTVVMVTAVVTAERTTRRHLRPKPMPETVVATSCDTIVPDSGQIVISGFDKPLRSSRETFFVSNRCGRTVTSLTVRLVYYDMSGRQLHSSCVPVECNIPAGETRQLSIRAWDRQQAFYYYLSEKPKRSRATPFRVKHNVESAILDMP